MSNSSLNVSVRNKNLLASQRIAMSRLLRSAMARQGLRFCDLPDKLNENCGVELTETNLRGKINKGSMGADLFLRLCEILNETDPIHQLQLLREKVEAQQ